MLYKLVVASVLPLLCNILEDIYSSQEDDLAVLGGVHHQILLLQLL